MNMNEAIKKAFAMQNELLKKKKNVEKSSTSSSTSSASSNRKPPPRKSPPKKTDTKSPPKKTDTKSPPKSPKKPADPTKYKGTQINLVFGEEQPEYYAAANEIHYEQAVDRFEYIKTIAKAITLQYTEDREQHVELIAGTYKDLVIARQQLGFAGGLKGKSLKGIVCAIYNIVLMGRREGRVDIKKLAKVANKVKMGVKSIGTRPVTEKMINNYTNFVLDTLSGSSTSESMEQENENFLRTDIKRLSIKMGYKSRQDGLYDIIKKAKNINDDLHSKHTPHVIAAGIVALKAYDNGKEGKDLEKIRQKLQVSRISLEKILKKLRPDFKPVFVVSTKRSGSKNK